MTELLNPMNEMLSFVNDLITLYSEESIKIPSRFHTQVSYIQRLLRSDTSGLINSLLDFAVDCALVDYKIETSNSNLTELLNNWLKTINADIRGRAGVEVGVRGLAKQYFIERWKNSSLCLLRSKWEDVKIGNSTFYLPTVLWFVDGGNVNIKDDGNETAKIGDEKYELKVGKSSADVIDIPKEDDEYIFVQKPYERWGSNYPVPFIIRRGLYKNLKFLELLSKKGEMVVGKALEYIFVIKKGLERVFIEKGISYDKKQLEQIKKDFKEITDRRKTEAGIPTIATLFDTQFEHLIPEYTRILQQSLYAPIEKKILSGLGFVEVIEGITTSRREGILNPRPFIKEVRSAIEDFKLILRDIFETIKEQNLKHRKYKGEIIEIVSTPIQDFISDRLRQELRLMYMYGVLSKETYTEVVGDIDFTIEKERRKNEASRGDDKLLYPPVTQNREGTGIDLPDEFDINGEPIDENKLDDKQKEIYDLSKKIFELAPYNEKNYPNYLNKYPASARSAWIKAFNSALVQYKDEKKAFKVAWNALKIYMRKHNLKMPKKSKGAIEQASSKEQIEQLLKIRELEILEKREKLLDKLLKESKE